MASKIPSIRMSNGVNFPLFGLGTWLAKDPVDLKTGLDAAIDAGYRYIDTAQLYYNEHIIGEFLAGKIKDGKIKREDIFITSKLSSMRYKPEDAELAIEKSFESLQTDYIDLFLMHHPVMYDSNFADPRSDPDHAKVALIPHIDTWKILEKYYKLGKFKAIGISNFNRQQIQDLYDKAEIKPHNLQVECHIGFPQHELHDFCKKLGITFTSYATIGSPGRVKKDPNEPVPLEVPLVRELAQKYHKTPAQILLKQMLQRGISVIPKSVTPTRIRENIDIFDFELTAEEMAKFADIIPHRRIFTMAYSINHPWYPFEKA